MIKFQKQESEDHVWVVYFDTVCDGYTSIKDENDNIVLFTENEAISEIEDINELCNDDEFHYEHMTEYVENRKVIFGKKLGCITGNKPLKQ